MTEVRHRPPERVRRRRARREARPASVVELYDAHVRALLAMANLLLDDGHEAEAVVVHVLRRAGPRRRAANDEADRRNLARGVYLRATRSRLGSSPGPHDLPARGSPTPPGDVRLTELSDQQRGVIALSLYGGHSHTDTADLMSLPTDTVDALLRTGLHRLSAAR